jgi:hypothetical protein
MFGQATKSIWWMPWRQKAMKGVISCDKLRRAANRPRSADSRMGKPGRAHTLSARDSINRFRAANGGK